MRREYPIVTVHFTSSSVDSIHPFYLDMEPSSTLSDLSQEIESRWRIPLEVQRLSVSTLGENPFVKLEDNPLLTDLAVWESCCSENCLVEMRLECVPYEFQYVLHKLHPGEALGAGIEGTSADSRCCIALVTEDGLVHRKNSRMRKIDEVRNQTLEKNDEIVTANGARGRADIIAELRRATTIHMRVRKFGPAAGAGACAEPVKQAVVDPAPDSTKAMLAHKLSARLNALRPVA